ncbi:MAG TPA: hypothetical protein EYG30_12000 [Planctomycetes bacterium]|jgi:hypothetical protein|nr:hypothetical protein [Planctomycetota bacterium]HIL52960.1 hypothetical protein [Planctomycetota bacterium]
MPTKQPSMKTLSTNALFACLLILLAGCHATRLTSSVGRAELGDDFDPVDEQTIAGLEISHVPIEGGIGMEFGLRYGKGSGSLGAIYHELENYEVYAGPRYEWNQAPWRPYLSAGLSAISVRGTRTGAESATLSDIGFYLGGGIDYEVGENMYLGLGLRKTFEQEGELYGPGELDSWQYLLRFGMAF